MATLTETAEIARKMVVIIIVCIVFIAIALISIPIIAARFRKPPPPVAPTADALFGKLPPIAFPQNRSYPASIRLENIEGRPPESTSSAKVYFIPKKSVTLYSRMDALSFAAKLGFTGTPQEISDIIYQFTDDEGKRTLTLDITNNNLDLLKTQYDSSYFQNVATIEENQALTQARNYFNNLSLTDQSLTKTKVSYFIYNNNQFIETKKNFEAQAVRVDFLRSEVGGLPVITADYDSSATFLNFVPQANNNLNLIEASWQNFAPDLTNASTYLSISASTAWENLKNGKGFIVRPLNNGTEAVIRNIYLAYFQTKEYQPYLQPVFVFEGDNDFIAVVPALDPSWIGN